MVTRTRLDAGRVHHEDQSVLRARPARSFAFAIAWCAPDVARADYLFPIGLYMPVGVSFGATRPSDSKAGVSIGGELSLAHIDPDARWWGAYVDGSFETAAERLRLSIGPELGWQVVGVDAGYALRIGEGEAAHGLHLRGLLTIGWVAAYARYGRFSDTDRHVADFGVLLKIPVEVATDRGWKERAIAVGPSVEKPGRTRRQTTSMFSIMPSSSCSSV